MLPKHLTTAVALFLMAGGAVPADSAGRPGSFSRVAKDAEPMGNDTITTRPKRLPW